MLNRSVGRALGSLSLALVASTAAAQPVVYRLVDLGPANATQTFSFGINDAGTVTGWTTVLGPTGKEPRALRSVNDVFTIPPGLDRPSMGLGINANGDLTGSVFSPFGQEDVMRYTDAGGVEDLGPPPGYSGEGFSINRFGQIAGWKYGYSGVRGFISGPFGLSELGTLGGPSSVAYGINDAGVVVGTSAVADGSNQAFVFRPGDGMHSLGIPRSGARGVNNNEQIAGSYVADGYSHPFRYAAGAGVQSLDPGPFRNGEAFAINDRGDVVGWFHPAGDVFGHAFVYSDNEGFVDLTTRIVAGGDGWIVLRATGINNRGEIVAQAFAPGSFFERAVKLIPADVVAPVIESASADPSVLWPPDGRMVAVTISAIATDDSDPAPQCAVEAVNVVDATFDSTDVEMTGGLSLRLRAIRSGHSDAGRTYEVGVACTDAAGNRAAKRVTVSVPHDSGGDDGSN